MTEGRLRFTAAVINAHGVDADRFLERRLLVLGAGSEFIFSHLINLP